LESKLAGFKPDVALVVGSGLGGITQGVTKPVVISYTDIPHFPKPPSRDMPGQMNFRRVGGRSCWCSADLHCYEGRTPAEITYPIHVVDALGVKVLIVTNAAGASIHSTKPGDLMVIEDHINHLGINPLMVASIATGASIHRYEPGRIPLACAKNSTRRPRKQQGPHLAGRLPCHHRAELRDTR